MKESITMTLAELLSLAQSHQWIPIFAVVIGALVRVAKDDTIGPTIPRDYRRLAAFLLGLAVAALDKVAMGGTWTEAASVAVGSPLLAVLGHHAVIDGLRGGREAWLPAFLRAADEAAPKSPPVKRINLGGIVLLVLLLATIALNACAEARTANSVREELCDLTGQEAAVRIGVDWTESAKAVWRETCKVRLAAAEQDAIGSIGQVSP